MKRGVVLLAMAATMLFAGTTFGSGKAHWGYSGHSGPENWAKLDKAFEMCGKGKNQSPINLSGFVEADLAPIVFSYKTEAREILNNGHSVQVNYEAGSTITVDGHQFELKQFHFHAPSENTVNGKYFPMEAHLVHADKDGNLAVVAVMIEEGSSNSLIEALWGKMPEHEGDKHALDGGLNVTGLLPKNKDYYRFNGSLTTPPCSEGVWWLVMKQPVTVSGEQIYEFKHVMHHPNNRPVQPVNARPVLR